MSNPTNATPAAAQGIIDEDFEITDLENPTGQQIDTTMAEGAADKRNDIADSNMDDHLPPIDADANKKSEKARQKQEMLAKELAALKAMKLEEKLALLKKYNPQEFYRQDQFVDACDTTDAFCFAKIMQVNPQQGNFSVNFDGWSSKWDLWFRFNSRKVAPFRSQHEGYSGQTKTALRNHMQFDPAELSLFRRQIEQMIANDLEGKTAHDTTQYLRGHLYVYSDFLLGMTFENEKDLSEAIEYQKAVLRLVVTYLNKVTTMQKSIYELNQNRELFLVDPMCAILASYPELMDMVRRLFACCQRALRFYLFNDVNQIDAAQITQEVLSRKDAVVPNTFGTVVQDFSAVDFKSRRILDEAKYIPDESKQRIMHKTNLVFGQMVNFVQYFADIGGFDAIVNLLKLGVNAKPEESKGKDDKAPDYQAQMIDLSMISSLLLPLRNLGQVLNPEFKAKLTKQIKDLVVGRLNTMTEKNLKDADKDVMTKLLNGFKQFLLLSNTDKETAQIIETTQLYVSLRFLQCGNLEKRLKGLNDIRTMVERVIQQMHKNSRKQSKYGQMIDDSEESKVPPSEFMTAEILSNWIHENKVLEIILGKSCHIEIVKRCAPILRFMSAWGGGKFDANTVAQVWKCQMGKHEEMVRTVYNLIQEILPYLNVDLVDQFYQRIQEMPPQQYDEKFLNFLHEFTKMALQKRFKLLQRQHEDALNEAKQQRANEIDLEQDSESFDSKLGQAERQTLSGLKADTLVEQASQPDQDHLYGLPIFWQIAQDQSNFGQDTEHVETMRRLAMKSIIDLLEHDFRKQIRLTYLLKCFANLLQRTSVVQSLQVATTIIKSCYVDQIEELRQYRSWGDDDQQGMQFISFFQERLSLMTVVIENVRFYHASVRNRLKLLQEKNKMPDNVDDFVFVGSYSHNKTLESLLEFIEYLVLQSQNDSARPNEFVSIGINNIQNLWQLFVAEPNFNQDQTQFLNWINKQRFQTMRSGFPNQQHLYGNQLVQTEQHIFTEEEKKFLFMNILCNPSEVKNMTLSLVKVFHRYFKQINKAEQNLNALKKKIKVLRFNELLGMDTLWHIALHSASEKVKDIVHELLVDLHLKFDHANVTQEHKAAVLDSFVQRCMHELDDEASTGKKAAIQLISLFLDRYEGIKPILPEAAIAQRLNTKLPTITILNCLDQENKIQKQIQVSYFQTLGYLRSQIASLFGIQIAEFKMIIKNQEMDPDIDDDTYIKDVQGLFNQVTMKANANYSRALHPKYSLAQSEKHFNTIFSMLKNNSDDPSLTELVWALISRLPTNQAVFEKFQTLNLIRQASPEMLQAAWSQLLDEKAVFNLLYCLKLINSTYLITSTMLKRDDEDQEKDAKTAGLHQWRMDFVKLGGFTHLLYVLANLKLDQIQCTLEIHCLKTLLEIIFKLLLSTGAKKLALLESQDKALLHQITLKVLRFIQLIAQFSIKEESARGESIEAIEQRIAQTKLRKYRQKMLMKGNKADDKKKSADEEEDEVNEDKKLIMALQTGFNSQIDILNYLFNFMNNIFQRHPETLPAIADFPHLEDLFVTGMLMSENINLRRSICSKFAEIVKNAVKNSEFGSTLSNLAQKILTLELTTVLPMTQVHQNRSNVFYEVLQDLIASLPLPALQPLQLMGESLISQLTDHIIQREFKEQHTADRDIFLQGQMQVLARLLQKFPQYKQEVGTKLTYYLIHNCLFEIPQGNQANSAPKCKNSDSRRAAFNLLATLSRDCLENLQIVLQYMTQFSSEVSWRTKKESDWNIKFFDDEKSSTGHVGIKNLGCICYMNSLNQQLFMIPGFRNDVLSIKDPNHDKNPDEDNMFLQWQNLFAGLLLSEKMYVNPKAYCHSFKDWEGNPVNIIEQMDVEEYLNMFMDKLESAIKGTPQEKTIQHHFGGTFANEIICKSCPHSYLRTENFLNVGVPVMNKKNLYEGLDAFVKGDMLEEGNQYMCEKCDKKVDALKRTCLQTLPRYLIVTLKRFEFDMDRMQRVKLNDYYEFKEEIDIAEYTHEYLSAKEKAQKSKSTEQDEEVKADSKEELLKQLKQPRAYYQYELVGIVVHSGTADSGHYYSYIKEQEAFKAQGSDKWYEFNDIWVRDFDPAEIPAECYGGEETAYQSSSWGNNQQKFIKYRNAYLLVYKRKLVDESLLVKEEAEAESIDQKPKYQLGSEELQLDVTSPLYKKIAADNHKYWQNRFLFGAEYFEFAQQIMLYWNTNRVIPHEVSWRNNDYHLLDQAYKPQHDLAKLPIQAIVPLQDIKVDLKSKYSTQDIQSTKLQVFKFAVQFYVTILQRSYDKNTLPDTVKYIRTYINDDETCARWLISEFVNVEVLQECFLDNTIVFMRQILSGMLYCAMLKVWETDRKKLNQYWEDIKKGSQQPRSTILGNFILALLGRLPQVLDYSNHQQQWFHMLARFSNLGYEARLFLLNAGAIERCMNFFHIKDTPYQKEFLEQQMPFFIQKHDLDIGLPTRDDPNQKQSMFSVLKEKQRQKKLHSENPKFLYLIETVANCMRSLHVESPYKLAEGQKDTPLQHENLGFVLTDHETTLIMPQADFIEKFVHAASKPRSISAIAKAYIHWSYFNEQYLNKMWDTVQIGLKKYDYNKIKPFLILFQHMLEAVRDSPAARAGMSDWLDELFSKVIKAHQSIYQWMETIIDFVIKIGHRIPDCKAWFVKNPDAVEYLLQWLKQNPEPPHSQYYGGYQSSMKMNKHKYTKMRDRRYDKTTNQAMVFIRRTFLMHLRDPQSAIDWSHEVDLDQLDMTDFKFTREMQIDYGTELNILCLEQYTVQQELEELLNIKFVGTETKMIWEAPEKNRIYPHGLISQTHLSRELNKVYEAIVNKQAQERVKQQQQQQMATQRINAGGDQGREWEGQDGDDSDGNRQQDAEMDFEEGYNQGNYYNALDPHSNATGGDSQNYDSNEGSDEDINQG